MALAAKDRFKDIDIKREVSVSFNNNNEPEYFKYKQVELTVLGKSKYDDLIPNELPKKFADNDGCFFNQYVATDKDGNIYECFIYGYANNESKEGYLKSIRSVPHK